ncbi:MAG: galactokinase [Rhodothermales bacterium]|jgi:galactokinase
MMSEVSAAFCERFGQNPSVVARAPGRLEILGNHTDYNEGLVISCAIAHTPGVAAAAASGDVCTLVSAADLPESRFSIADPGSPIEGDWANYVKGIVCELRKRGFDLAPFDMLIDSDIPRSAGLSSSAALEIAVAYAIGALNGIELPPVEWARIGQASENNYVGANTGLLDQLSSVLGKAGHIVACDFRSITGETRPFSSDAVFVVANTGVTHDLTFDYNERRMRCEEAAELVQLRYPDVQALRDVSQEMLEACRETLELLTYRRARHIVGEDHRVKAGLSALGSGDLEAFGQLLFDSHYSSRHYFENSCRELDILVELSRSLPGCLGARLSGGGFGGCSIHLVTADEAQLFADRLATAYKTRTGKKIAPLICELGAGAEVVFCAANPKAQPTMEPPCSTT